MLVSKMDPKFIKNNKDTTIIIKSIFHQIYFLDVTEIKVYCFILQIYNSFIKLICI